MSRLTKFSMSPLASLAVFAFANESRAVATPECNLRISTRYPDVRSIVKANRSQILLMKDDSGDMKYEFRVDCELALEFLKSDFRSDIVCDNMAVHLQQTRKGEVAYYHRVCTGNGSVSADLPYTWNRGGAGRAATLGPGVSIEDRF